MRMFSSMINRFKSHDTNAISARISRAGKWSFYFLIIGLIAGLGSIVFHYLCLLGLHWFMDFMAGYVPPAPAGEHHLWAPTGWRLNRRRNAVGGRLPAGLSVATCCCFCRRWAGLSAVGSSIPLRRKRRDTGRMPPLTPIIAGAVSCGGGCRLSKPLLPPLRCQAGGPAGARDPSPRSARGSGLFWPHA